MMLVAKAFDEETIYRAAAAFGQVIFSHHVDYTHFNPVQHGLVEHPADWPYSSFRRCVDRGFYPDGWRGGSDEPRQTGERS
jgi:hypothetical protein